MKKKKRSETKLVPTTRSHVCRMCVCAFTCKQMQTRRCLLPEMGKHLLSKTHTLRRLFENAIFHADRSNGGLAICVIVRCDRIHQFSCQTDINSQHNNNNFRIPYGPMQTFLTLAESFRTNPKMDYNVRRFIDHLISINRNRKKTFTKMSGI